MVEIGMTSCLPVRSALTKKDSRGGWTRSGPTPPDLSSRSLHFTGGERDSLVYQFFGKYHPSAHCPAQKFRRGLRKVYIYISCVLLVDQCNTTTTKYN